MSILKKIFNKLKNKLKQAPNTIQSEDEYYEQLFIRNNKWNKSEPNQEELLRWNIIKEFIDKYVLEYLTVDQKNASILDLGCGRGWLTNLLSNYAFTIGIEPVEKVANYAQKLFPKLTIKTGTSQDLFPDYKNKFDLVVSSEVIEHIPDDLKSNFVSEINELLNSKGFVIITTPRKEVQDVWSQFIGAEQPVEDWISELELKNLFLNNQFKEIDVRRISIIPRENAPLIEIYQLWIFQKE